MPFVHALRYEKGPCDRRFRLWQVHSGESAGQADRITLRCHGPFLLGSQLAGRIKRARATVRRSSYFGRYVGPGRQLRRRASTCMEQGGYADLARFPLHAHFVQSDPSQCPAPPFASADVVWQSHDDGQALVGYTAYMAGLPAETAKISRLYCRIPTLEGLPFSLAARGDALA